MKRSSQTLALLALAYLLLGLVLGIPWLAAPYHKALELLAEVFVVIAVYRWCYAEAAERGSAPPARSALWAALLAPIFLPAYLLRTRPPLRAAAQSLIALAYYLAMVALMMASSQLSTALLS